jgi:hypothetical protein
MAFRREERRENLRDIRCARYLVPIAAKAGYMIAETLGAESRQAADDVSLSD